MYGIKAGPMYHGHTSLDKGSLRLDPVKPEQGMNTTSVLGLNPT